MPFSEANALLRMEEAGVSFVDNRDGFHVEDTRGFAIGGFATMSALRKQGCPALPPAGRPGVDHPVAFALAAVPLPPMQRAASGFFLSPQASQGNRNRCRRIRIEQEV